MADENKKPKAKKPAQQRRRSRLSKDDQALIVRGLQALVREEEDRELEFARRYVFLDNEEGGQERFGGDYAELCRLYQEHGIAFGSDGRARALDLLARLRK